MLFTVNKSPFTTNNLSSCLEFAGDKDPILLYEDAVLGAQQGSKIESTLKTAMQKNPIYALKEDLDARGIKNIIAGIQVITYDGFVDLVEKHKVNPWL